ncbi:putative leucine-rich repeat receptor-like protein kinase [Dorcoceras hygrometricum]|uniref:Putative leucine-rich repeat receptor-like protein kinase n=1 Tax=Dorcoceras hygrometricum TaxID=472368 RepID=A0A2Z7CTU0_9LAMI|nr:putative leucine-rich repeat receptor-like protein kinase [Dorcoceras hygrometricum]
MPPRRGIGRTTRRTVEESRAGSDDDVHQVEDVTRQIGDMELVLDRFQRTNPPTFSAAEGGAMAEAWFAQMEELFDTLEYAPDKRLKLVVLQIAIGYPRMSASGESSTTMHRLLHASGSHPIPTPYDLKCLNQISRGFNCGNRCTEIGSCLVRLLFSEMAALSVIPRGSWGDVARRSYHDPMGKSGNCDPGSTMVVGTRLAVSLNH